MKRWIAFFFVLFAALPALAGSWTADRLKAGGFEIFTWAGGDSGDQAAIDVSQCGQIGWTAEITSGTPSVPFYMVPAPNTSPASSGTLLFTATVDDREIEDFDPAPLWLMPTVTTAGGGGKVTIRCAAYARAAARAESIAYNAETPQDWTDWILGGVPENVLDAIDRISAWIAGMEIVFCKDYLAGGTDYGAACTAAYQALRTTIAQTNTGGIVVAPRGDTFQLSTPIDWCDETGRGAHLASVEFVGKGSNRGGNNGTRFAAAAALGSASARTGTTTLNLSQNGGTGGRDAITCTSCNFGAGGFGFQRGDIIKIDGFDSAFDTDAGGAAIQPVRLLVVFTVEALTLTVENQSAVDAGFTNVTGDANESVTELTEMFRTCTRNVRVRDMLFDGAGIADIVLHAYADNSTVEACVDTDIPFDECTGPAAATGLTAITVKGLTFEDVVAEEALVVNVVARSATNTMGQQDDTVFSRMEIIGVGGANETPVGLWVDNLQAQGVVVLRDSDVAAHSFRSVWVTAGGVGIDNTTIVMGQDAASPARTDAHGAAQAVGFAVNNLNESWIRSTAFDLYEVAGIVGTSSAGSDTDQIALSITDGTTVNWVTLTHAESAFTWDNEGGLFADESVSFCALTGATTLPTVTIGNDDEATRPLALYFGARTDACLGGTIPVTYTDSVFNRALTRNAAIHHECAASSVMGQDLVLLRMSSNATLLRAWCASTGAITTTPTYDLQECDSAIGSCTDNTGADLTCGAVGATTTTFGGAAGSAVDIDDVLYINSTNTGVIAGTTQFCVYWMPTP